MTASEDLGFVLLFMILKTLTLHQQQTSTSTTITSLFTFHEPPQYNILCSGKEIVSPTHL